jgi:hypothetical protein
MATTSTLKYNTITITNDNFIVPINTYDNIFYSGNGGILTLPLTESGAEGQSINFVNLANVDVMLQSQFPDFIKVNDGTVSNQYKLVKNGNIQLLIYNSLWIALNIGGQAVTIVQEIKFGDNAGYSNQGDGAVAMGNNSGYSNQGVNAVAIGANSGYSDQGANSVAIGSFAAYNSQATNSIIINATGSALDSATNGLFIAPIRPATTTQVLYYNVNSSEITHGAVSGGGGSVNNPMSESLDAGGYNITNINNLGIGTGSPQYNLDIVNSGANLPYIHLEGSGGVGNTVGIILDPVNRSGGPTTLIKAINSASDVADLVFYTAALVNDPALERLRITSNGYVGIGGTPSNILQVGNGGRLRIANNDTDYSLIGASDTDNNSNVGIKISGVSSASGGVIEYLANPGSSIFSHKFYSDVNTVGMTINNSGYTLDVNGSINLANGNFYINGNPISGGNNVQNPMTNSLDANNYSIVNVSSLAIGTAVPTQQLDVRGNAIIGNQNNMSTLSLWGPTNAPANNLPSIYHRETVGMGISSDDSISFQVNNGTDAVRINNLGYVGVGITTPSNILQVGGGGRLRIANSNDDYSILGTNDADGNNNTRIVVSGINRAAGPGSIEYISATSPASYSHIFYTDISYNAVQINKQASTYLMQVAGSINLTSGNYYVNGSLFSAGFAKSPLDANLSANGYNIISVNQLGINTANPSAHLEIVPDATLKVALQIYETNNFNYASTGAFAVNKYSGNGYVYFDNSGDTGYTFRKNGGIDWIMNIDNNGNINIPSGANYSINGNPVGNVQNPMTANLNAGNHNINNLSSLGIGVSTPYGLIDLGDSIQDRKIILYGTGDNYGYYGFGISGDTLRYNVISATDSHVFYSLETNELMRIVGNGNVGIGAPNPEQKLDVFGNLIVGNRTDTASILLNGPSASSINPSLPGIYHKNNVGLGISSDFEMAFEVNGSTESFTAMYINATGFVGIGTSEPVYPLEVNGDINISGNYLKNGIPITSSSQWITSGNNIYYNTGNVGIGKATPTYKLDIFGNINITGNYLKNGTPITGSSQWVTSGDDIYFNTGNVGIGKDLTVGRYLKTDTALTISSNIISPELMYTSNLMGLNNIQSLADGISYTENPPATVLAGSNSWLCSMNISGKYIFTITDNVIYRSENYAASFTNTGITAISVDCSGTGKYVVAISGAYSSTIDQNKIIFSSDYGVTWSNIYPASGFLKLNDVTISETGQYILCLPLGNDISYVYRSADYGQTWQTINFTVTGPNTDTVYCDMSYDGKYQYFIKINGYMYRSSDYGATWAELINNGIKYWYGINCSRDGKFVIASDFYTGVYVSDNYADSFTQRYSISSTIGRVGVSYDGRFMAALGQNNTNLLYLSFDYGVTWDPQYFENLGVQPIDVALNYTGNLIFVSCNGGSKLQTFPYAIGINQAPILSSALSIRGNVQTPFFMFAQNFIYTSDARIKKDIEVIPDNLALEKLRLIEPKQYLYIDESRNIGDQKVFGFIAQEVGAQFPNTIEKITDYVPNIYQTYQFVKTSDNEIIVSNLADKVILNDILKINIEKEFIATVNEISGSNVKLKLDTEKLYVTGGDVFIYGKKVNDFNMLKKDYLYTINFAATQELDRIINWHTKEQDPNNTAQASYGDSLLTRIKILENENASLKSQLTLMQNQINDILARL